MVRLVRFGLYVGFWGVAKKSGGLSDPQNTDLANEPTKWMVPSDSAQKMGSIPWLKP